MGSSEQGQVSRVKFQVSRELQRAVSHGAMGDTSSNPDRCGGTPTPSETDRHVATYELKGMLERRAKANETEQKGKGKNEKSKSHEFKTR